MRRIILALALLLLPVAVAQAATLKLGECSDCTGSADDTFMSTIVQANNYGVRTDFYIGLHLSYRNKMILRFDLSTLPSDAIVFAVVFGFEVDAINTAAPTLHAFGIHNDNNDWAEGTANGAAQVGSPCYADHTYNSAQEWAGSIGLSTSGTDFYATSYGSTVASVGSKTITFNATGRTFVQDRRGTDGAEFLIWTDGLPGSNQSALVIAGEHATAADRPYLEITYTSGAQIITIMQ